MTPTIPSESYPTVLVKPGEADRLLAGHPWLYEGSVLRVTREVKDGEVVQVKDHRQRLLGTGFFNSRSRIRVRLLARERVRMDAHFFETRIKSALEHRRRWMSGASSYRLVNAESDGLSGLIIDWYEGVAVMQTSSLGMDLRKREIVEALNRVAKPRAVVERNDMGSRKFEGMEDAGGVLAGSLEEAELARLSVRMNNLNFEVNLATGHKTGIYLDQQLNYQLAATLAGGGAVLDAFCFQGGFALHAAKLGASSVLGLDQSEEAIGVARRLAEVNRLASKVSFETANVFDWLKSATSAAGGKTAPCFDLIILDPPSFTRNRASVGDALRGYKEIHLRALKLLKPGGVLATFCCSHHVDASLFEEVILGAAYDARRVLRRVRQFTQPDDHPILPSVPETEYLKGFAYDVVGR